MGSALGLYSDEIKEKKKNNPKYRIHDERVSTYKLNDGLDFTGIDFPTPLKHIPKIEKQNKLNINVFGLEICNDKKEEFPYPLYISKETNDIHINLLLFTREVEEEGEKIIKSHYCWIKNFSALFSNGKSKYEHKLYFCYRCLSHFYTPQKLKIHDEICQGLTVHPSRVILPEEDKNILKFKNFKNLQ